MELTFPQIPKNIVQPKPKRRFKIDWTPPMVEELTRRFPTDFNKDIAKDLGVSWRSLVRKARELGLEKEDGFLEKKRGEIVKLIAKVRKPNPAQTGKGFVIPNSEQYRFKKGDIPRIKTDPELVKRIHDKRNETIRRDRLRRKYGLSPITKLKLN